MSSAFVGRARELSSLRDAVQEARAASPRVMVVEGPAGIGKTALVHRFLTEVTDAVVLRASGEEAETTLAYGVLDQLWTEADVEAVGDVADPLAAGAALLELLGDLQERGLVVVVVDDAQWSDTPSLHALVFALRRLRVDRVLAMLVVREDEGWRLPGAVGRLVDSGRGSAIHLKGLTPSELAAVAQATGAGVLTPVAARRLYDHTRGNPLHATALLNELGAEGLSPLGPDPLPAPRSYAAVVLDRLASCREETQRLVEAGAVLGVRWRLDVAGQVAGVENALDAGDEATNAGLLASGGSAMVGLVEFAHPLVQAAVYHRLGPGERAALHSRAAVLTLDEGRALRHRTAAASRSDPRLVADLCQFARAQAARQAWAAAAEAALSAGRLTTGRVEAQQLLVDAFEFLVAAGDIVHSSALADEADGWEESARRSYVLGLRAFVAGQPDQGEVLLADASERCDPAAEPVLAGRIASLHATRHLNRGDADEAIAWAERALQRDPDGAATTSFPPRLILTMSLGALGRHREGLRLCAALPDPLPEPLPHQVDELLGRGILRLWSDDLAGAIGDLTGVTRACRRRGSMSFAINGLCYLADAEYRRGRWNDAAVHADLAITMADDVGWVPGRSFSHGVAAFVSAARGEHDRAAEHARTAAAAAGDPAELLWAAVAQARVAQALSDPVGQAAACVPLIELSGREPMEEPTIQPWRELYAEALVRLGHLGEAEAVLGAVETRLERGDRASARCGASRVKGLLAAARGDARAARSCFEAALAAAVRVGMPFARAQVELDWGSFLRRQRHRRAALDHLQGARSALARLGAGPFLDRCERELHALGMGPAPEGRPTQPHLTPQERAVAHLAGTGMTNRQIAAELMLSVKTVEYHLGNVFAKLDVRSRGQMTARLAGSPPRRDHQSSSTPPP